MKRSTTTVKRLVSTGLLVLALAASAGSASGVGAAASAGGSGPAAPPSANPCEPLHDYKGKACDKAWRAAGQRHESASPARGASQRPPSRCAPLHDYKSGRC